jgi:WD40 repeat protein
VTGSSGGEIVLWDGNTLSKKKTIAQINSEVHDVQFSPDGKYLAGVSEGSGLVVWETVNFSQVHESGGQSNIGFSADGKRLAVLLKDGRVDVLETENFTKIKSLKGMKVVALSPRGDLLATTEFIQTMSSQFLKAVVYELSKNAGRALTSKESWINALSFSPCGRWLACGLQEGMSLMGRSHLVAVWKLPEYQRVQELKHDRGELTDSITGAMFTPNGKYLVSSCMDGTIKVWNAGSFQCVQELKWEGVELNALAVTDTRIAAGCEHGFSVWSWERP